jgi:hypothetical protein
MKMRKATFWVAAVLLAGCAAPEAPRTALAPPLRPTLAGKWVDAAGGINWPPADGFAGAPIPIVLPAGLLLDRFGSPSGRFFSPKNAGYAARALPYSCDKLAYTTYRVKAPLVVWIGRAAPWFDESGGATQFQTDATAAQLVADATIEPVPGASGAPCPK